MSNTLEYNTWMDSDKSSTSSAASVTSAASSSTLSLTSSISLSTSPVSALSALSYYLPANELLADNYKLDGSVNSTFIVPLNVSLVSLLNETAVNTTANQLINNHVVQGCFFVLYAAIFTIGLFGNVLVCYVVCRNKAMQTVTNMFITNLALSDILLCVLAVPFTPLYTFLGRWIFGRFLCHMVSYAQGCSVYISTLTLTAIAMDRFFVIIYPFHPRMKIITCLMIICAIWIFSLLLTLPYGLYMSLNTYDKDHYCEEDWPSESSRKLYGSVTVALQFILPFLIISVCYILVSIKLNDRARAKPGCKTSKKEEADRERKKRTNRMLISMVGVFGISWLPLNSVNIFNDFYETKSDFYTLLFFVAHCVAMSSTCYNPFLYAWLNENFRKEFKQVLPCFRNSGYNNNGYNNSRVPRPERTFYRGNNGDIEIGQESLLPINSTRTSEIIPREATYCDNISRNQMMTTTTTTSDTSAIAATGLQKRNNNLTSAAATAKTTYNSPNKDGLIVLNTVHSKAIVPSVHHSLTTVLDSGVLETPFDDITAMDDFNGMQTKINKK